MLRIPILDLKKQIQPIRREIDAAIKSVIDNASFVFGREIAEFEAAAAAYCRVKYAIGVSNGTDAIRLALAALGVGAQDAVICPAFTYYATAGAIASLGAIPVFAEIDPATYNISVAHTERLLKQKGLLRIKAIVPVHLFGQCAEMDYILKIAKKYDVKIVEDAAQAFGAEYKGRKAGTLGDCGAVSFFPGKNLGAFGDAGMVLTNNKIVAERIQLLRNQGNRKKYQHLIIGCNNRMDSIQAAVLKVKLKYLDLWNKKRRKNAAYLNRHLSGLGLGLPSVLEGNTHIYHQYTLRIPAGSNKLMQHLNNKGIDARVYYPIPLHLQKCFRYLGYERGDFPEAERAAKDVLSIPVYPDLTNGQLDYIINTIREFMR